MRPESELIELLMDFDGKSVQPFRSLAAECPLNDETVRTFLDLADHPDPKVEIGATWVLKNLAERREQRLDQRLSGSLVALLPKLHSSVARLHLLQMLPMCELGKASVAFLRQYLPKLLAAEQHGLTRAWVFNGFAEIARCDPSYRDTAVAVLSEAYQSERAAVRARIRNALDDL